MRLWLDSTRRGEECETAPDMNSHRTGAWNETFVLPVLRHLRRAVLVVEVLKC